MIGSGFGKAYVDTITGAWVCRTWIVGGRAVGIVGTGVDEVAARWRVSTIHTVGTRRTDTVDIRTLGMCSVWLTHAAGCANCWLMVYILGSADPSLLYF